MQPCGPQPTGLLSSSPQEHCSEVHAPSRDFPDPGTERSPLRSPLRSPCAHRHAHRLAHRRAHPCAHPALTLRSPCASCVGAGSVQRAPLRSPVCSTRGNASSTVLPPQTFCRHYSRFPPNREKNSCLLTRGPQHFQGGIFFFFSLSSDVNSI